MLELKLKKTNKMMTMKGMERMNKNKTKNKKKRVLRRSERVVENQ